MMTALHDGWSKAVDGVTFGLINTIQLRNKGGSHTREELKAYVNQWKDAPPEQYYALPEEDEPMDLPQSGVKRFHTGHPTACRENDWLNVEVSLGPDGWRSPAMILLHGLMSVSDVGYRFWARHLNNLGWTSIFFHLPYHYGRCPKGALSSEMAITSNLIRTAEGIRQGVIDLRRLCRSLKSRGAPKVGVWATSYGGWMGSLLCVVEKELDTAWLIEPITDVAHAIWKSPSARTMRWQLAKRGILPEHVEPHFRLVCPSFHDAMIPADQILLVAGLFDEVTPVESIQNLHRKWNGSHYAEIRQGHIGYQLMPASWRLAREHMPKLFV